MTDETSKEVIKIYPICPECGYNTIVGFQRPEESSSASLYCCNGETNCKFNTKFSELTTPMKEDKYYYKFSNKSVGE